MESSLNKHYKGIRKIEFVNTTMFMEHIREKKPGNTTVPEKLCFSAKLKELCSFNVPNIENA